MKLRIFFIFFLLLVSSVAVFYFSWINRYLSSDEAALVYIKNQGYTGELVRADKFYFNIRNTIPNFLELHKLSLTPKTINNKMILKLPDAETYYNFYDISAKTDFSIEYDLNYSVKTEEIQTIFEIYKDIGNIHNKLSQVLRLQSNSFLQEVFFNQIGLASEATASQNLYESLQKEMLLKLERDFHYLEITDFQLSMHELPDFSLYNKARSEFLHHQEIWDNRIRQLELEFALAERTEDRQLAILEKVGNILTEYPTLLDYFRMHTEMISPFDIFDFLGL